MRVRSQECRLWIQDNEWVSAHICRQPQHYKKYTTGTVADIISGPLTPGFGRKLNKIFRFILPDDTPPCLFSLG